MGGRASSPVCIVGGGPVGLTLALFLDLFDVKSVVFNIDKTTRWHPKGNGQSSRSMEHFRRLGIVDEVRELGIPQDHPFDHGVFTRLSTHEIFRFHRPTQAQRLATRLTTPSTDQYVEPTYHMNQMYLERALHERAKARSNITLCFGWSVERFSQDDAGVTLRARSLDAGEEVDWRASYVAACDGAQGKIRRELGIAYEGDVSTQDYYSGRLYSIYMRIPDLLPKFLGQRRAWMYWTLNDDASGLIISLNGADEFMMLAKPNADEGKMNAAEVQRWVQRAIGADIPVEIISYQPWNAGAALVAGHYVSGRIALAGDSAHLFTPTGGFGMSTGIDDTSNLAWKLAALVQGWGGPELLQSYEIERKPIGHRNTGAARYIARNWHAPEATPDLESAGPAGEAARREARNSSYVKDNHFFREEEVDATGVQLGARYDGSPVIVPDGEPPSDNLDEYIPSGVPGGRAPHLWLDTPHLPGTSLFDRLCVGFTLLRFGDTGFDADPLARAAKARGVPFAVLDVALPEARALYGRKLALIRPDQYIAWRGDRLPDDPDALLARVTGFVARTEPRAAAQTNEKLWKEDTIVD